MFYILPSQGCSSVNRSKFCFFDRKKSLSPISMYNFIFHIKNHTNFSECKFFLLRFSFISCFYIFFLHFSFACYPFSSNFPSIIHNFPSIFITQSSEDVKILTNSILFDVDFISNFLNWIFLFLLFFVH